MSDIVYIDGANLHQSSKSWWWIDYDKFSIWLHDKYKSCKIYMFLWYIAHHTSLYNDLSQQGYRLIFKETLKIDGKVKGNCDAELVLKAVSDYYEYTAERAILVTWDGDFGCLVEFYKNKLFPIVLLAPSKKNYSYLLKKKNVPTIFLEEHKFKYKKKAPDRDLPP